jgi:glycosyltransferase involved in cell wall biosynthesis
VFVCGFAPLATKYGKSCEVIPNGVVFSDPPQENNKVVELGLEPGRYVLTVGRLVPEKRQLDLLRAFCVRGTKRLEAGNCRSD